MFTASRHVVLAVALGVATSLAGGIAHARTGHGRTAHARAQLVAQKATRETPGREALNAERQTLRAKLEAINAEIEALKRQDRGLRDDYRLRARMADAEALARRLTRIDAMLGTSADGENTRRAEALADTPPPVPEARPTDDRVALEAKADILVDQARRLDTQADRLAQRLSGVRARQELKRRSGQLERDPFSPLEQARRRMAIGTAATPGGLSTGTESGRGAPGAVNDAAGSPTTAGGAGNQGPAPGTAPGSFTTPPPATTGGDKGAATPTANPGTTLIREVAPPPAPVAGDAPGSVAAQFRGILDSATLAEIRRLEAPGAPGASVQAMEKALAALRARSARLDEEARLLRQRARTPTPPSP